jgi:predicted RNA-binding Zn ribbon-like protein
VADSAVKDFILVANDPALDLLNTTPVLGQVPVEQLTSMADVADWLAAAGVLTPGQSRALAGRASSPKHAAAALTAVREFRESLRFVVNAIVLKTAIPPPAVNAVNQALRLAGGFWKIHGQPKAGRFSREFQRRSDTLLSRTLAPIAQAAAALLCDRDVSAIKKCDNPACVLYFYDTSRNRTRRWCSMQTCGNRMKVAAHYRRHHP